MKTSDPSLLKPHCDKIDFSAVLMEDLDQLKNKILKLSAEYAARRHHQTLPATDPRRLSIDRQAPIPYAGRVFSEDEVVAAVSSSLDYSR